MAKQLHILLADDDEDDRFFFNMAVKALSAEVKFTTVEDGEKLMNFLSAGTRTLPDVLFLDLNMPRKNGSECLLEIKSNKALKDIPVIIYSTSMHDDIADTLYGNGAHYYSRKTDVQELQKVLRFVLEQIAEKKFERPSRDKFILKMPETELSN
ncbi:MAG: response regulator [Bacteroidetes bacterium]|nr:response regulator [Bacteroidota bacterium]